LIIACQFTGRELKLNIKKSPVRDERKNNIFRTLEKNDFHHEN